MVEAHNAQETLTLTSEQIPYPRSTWLKYAYRSPVLFYRMGLGWLVGQLFMVLTTAGRKSGLPRRTAIEFHTVAGRTVRDRAP